MTGTAVSRRPITLLYVIPCLLAVFLGFTFFITRWYQEIRGDADDSVCRSKLKSLGTWLACFGEYYGCFPPPSISDQTGQPLYSWRVLALPTYGHLELFDAFDFTNPWNDRANMNLCQGKKDVFLELLFSCPATRHTKPLQTDYFYALNARDQWPRDFFYDANTAPHIVLVESQGSGVYWSEPVDLNYQQPGMKGFLGTLRGSKAVHRGGFNCFVSDGSVLKIPEDSNLVVDLSVRMPRIEAGAGKEQTAILVARLRNILGDRQSHGALYSRHTALLLLGELGPQAKAAVPMIRQILAQEHDERLTRVAAFALAKIEK